MYSSLLDEPDSMLDYESERGHSRECDGSCQVCLQTRRMVSSAVAGSMKEILTLLEQEDLDGAQKHAAALLAVLEEAPQSTVTLIGAGSLADLRNAIEKGLWDISSGDFDAGRSAFQAGLSNWYETYPPYQA